MILVNRTTFVCLFLFLGTQPLTRYQSCFIRSKECYLLTFHLLHTYSCAINRNTNIINSANFVSFLVSYFNSHNLTVLYI